MCEKGKNIYKRQNGRWEGRDIKFQELSGKTIYSYIYAATYEDARTKLKEYEDSEEYTLCEDGDPLREDLFEIIAAEWLNFVKIRIKESTYNKYWNLLSRYILPMFKNRALTEINFEYICEKCNQLLIAGGQKGTGLSPKTVSDILSLIRNILQFAAQKGKAVPCDLHSIHIKQHTNEIRVLSRAEQNKLCRYLYSNLCSYNIGILLCLFTGLRVGEVCALRWEDFSFTEKTVYVHKTMQRLQDRTGTVSKTKVVITTPKSACSIRTIPIPDGLIKILSSYKSSSEGYFLTNNDKKYIEPRTMQNHFKKALQKSQVDPANYHALRHTFATRCIELGFDVKSLSEILGHASVSITMNRYVHPSMELKKENMQRLSSLLVAK